MGNLQTEAALRASCGSPTAKSVLLVLSFWANQTTGLQWHSVDSIAEATEFSNKSVRRALGALEERGHISRLNFSGRQTLMLVHPDGADPIDLSIETATTHLRSCRKLFDEPTIAQAVAWLASLGRLPHAEVARSIAGLAKSAIRARKKSTTPDRVSGVTDADPGHSVPAAWSESPPTLDTVTTEQERTQKEPKPRDPVSVSKDPDTSAARRTKPGPRQTNANCFRKHRAKSNRRLERVDWRGDPKEVLERLRAAGGEAASKLKGKSDADALAMIEEAQRVLFARGSDLKAVA